jgi:hypothetical protein
MGKEKRKRKKRKKEKKIENQGNKQTGMMD